eukprot:m.77999 g.77999  ORF g.77999 m.77999 type:complete len:54 (-) comp20715_c0_seq2:222-383(-)
MHHSANDVDGPFQTAVCFLGKTGPEAATAVSSEPFCVNLRTLFTRVTGNSNLR